MSQINSHQANAFQVNFKFCYIIKILMVACNSSSFFIKNYLVSVPFFGGGGVANFIK